MIAQDWQPCGHGGQGTGTGRLVGSVGDRGRGSGIWSGVAHGSQSAPSRGGQSAMRNQDGRGRMAGHGASRVVRRDALPESRRALRCCS